MKITRAQLVKRLSIAALILTVVGTAVSIWMQVKPTPRIPNLSGTWTCSFLVQESRHKAYIGDISVFDLYITQEQNKLEGNGELVTYRNHLPQVRFKMKLTKGFVHDDYVEFRYDLDGTRPTEGFVRARILETNPLHLSGTFEGSAADVKGIVDIRIR
jgi:hypothetical protein